MVLLATKIDIENHADVENRSTLTERWELTTYEQRRGLYDGVKWTTKSRETAMAIEKTKVTKNSHNDEGDC